MKVIKRVCLNILFGIIAVLVVFNIYCLVLALVDLQLTGRFVYALELNIFKVLNYHVVVPYLLLMVGVILVFEGLVHEVVNKSGRRKLSKYDLSSYKELMSIHQRLRGTVMVKFDAYGEPVNTGFIKRWQRLKNPVSKLQRKILTYYNKPEIKKWNVLEFDKDGTEVVKAGIPVFAMRRLGLFGKYDKVWFLKNSIHSQFIGSTGRGKTMTYVLPMIVSSINAGRNVLVHDPKRELDAYTRRLLEKEGYKIITIDFVEQKKSDGWNPLTLAFEEWNRAIDDELSTWDRTKNGNYTKVVRVKEYYDYASKKHIEERDEKIVIKKTEKHKAYKYANLSKAVELVQDIAKTLSWEEDAKDPLWHTTAGEMIAGAVIFLMEEGDPDCINLFSARKLIEEGDSTDDKEGIPLLTKYLKLYREKDADSAINLQTYLEAQGNTKPSFRSMFMSKMSLITSTEDIRKLTSYSTFNIEECLKQKTVIFLKTHDEKSIFYPIVTMFMKQLYEAAIRVSRDYPNQKLPIEWDWHIDEMGLLPEIKDIQSLYGAARSRGIRINGFAQTFEQLEETYGDNVAKISEDNCSTVIYLGSQSESTRDRFSKLAGNKLVYNNVKKDYEERPVITAERLASFEHGRSLVNTIEWNPFISKLPPYTKYVFASNPIWELEDKKKPEVKRFDIKNSWFDKLNGQKETRSKRLSKIGAEVTNELYEDTSGYTHNQGYTLDIDISKS